MWLRALFRFLASIALWQAMMQAAMSIWDGAGQAAAAYCLAALAAWLAWVASRIVQPDCEYEYSTGELLRLAFVGTYCTAFAHKPVLLSIQVVQYDADGDSTGEEEQSHLCCERCGSQTILQLR